MMLDDMYDSDVDSDVDERILKKETAWRDRLLPELEWDETEDSRVVEELLGSANVRDEPA